MGLSIERTTFEAIAPLRDHFRAEAGCQIVRDSILGRGLADPWVVRREGEVIGYAGVWNEYDPGRLMEFWVAPDERLHSADAYALLLERAGVVEVEAQSNLFLMHEMLQRFGREIRITHHLFEAPDSSARPGLDAASPNGEPIAASELHLRAAESESERNVGDWIAEQGGVVVGGGGLMRHYNPPYVDVYMSVDEAWRRQGIGTRLVAALCRKALDEGSVPAARCSVANDPSRRTLERGGMTKCGEILVADAGAVGTSSPSSQR